MFRATRDDECAQGVEEFEAEALPHLDKLFRIAAWLTQDRAAAETLVLETLDAAFDSIRELEGEADACVWLIGVMYRTKNKPRRGWWLWGNQRMLASGLDGCESDGVATFEPRTPRDITEEEMLDALRSLSSPYQELVLLSDIEGLTYKEAAQVLGVTVGVVMIGLTRARKMLRAGLRPHSLDHSDVPNEAAYAVIG